MVIVDTDFWEDFLVRLGYNWRLFVAIAAPILLSPIAWAFTEDIANVSHDDDSNQKFRAAYCIALMAVYWLLEVIPLAITALLPLVIFPLMNVQDSASISKNYMKESNMIFLGALILALSIEYCGLHIRVALRVISIFGTQASRIMFATMIIAAATSMWLSDTSTTTMLLPILSAITSAMFREEQFDVAAREEIDGDATSSTPNKGGTDRRRTRRESTVFTNSAMESSVRRKLRKTSQVSGKISSINSVPSAVGTLSRTESSLEARTITDAAGRRESRDFSSMSIIMEGVPIPDEKQDANGKTIATLARKVSEDSTDSEVEHSELTREQRKTNIRKMLLYAVAYSASIGGTGSLVGTGPIKVFKELIKEYKLEKHENTIGITFATWMGFNSLPLLINIIIVWVYLSFRYIGVKELCTNNNQSPSEKQQVKAYLKAEYEKLGPVSAHEVGVGTIFICVVLLWIFRDPQIFPGWKSLIHAYGAGDSTPAMLGCILLFVLPKDWSFIKCTGADYTKSGKYEALLDWKFVSSNAPWGYVLLIGSGYAIADASQQSGLSFFIAEELKALQNIPASALLLIVMLITCFLTQIVSNTACASLILPVLFSVSCGSKIHPIYLTMASAVTSSYAFMLPISSPPNAIIFATGELNIREMFWNGAALTVVCLLVLYLSIITYGDFIFHFSAYPTDENMLPIYNYCSNTTKCH